MRRGRLTLADARSLLRGAGRTSVLRLALAALAVAGLAAVFLTADEGRTGEPPLDAPGKTTMLVVDVSSSIRPDVFRQIRDTLDRASAEGGRFGVVLFSDIAYEMLAPGTPARELDGLRRFFDPVETPEPGIPLVSVGRERFPRAPWNESLTSGTMISRGLELARAILVRDGIRDGSVVLVSDLEDEYLDVPELARSMEAYAAAKLPLRVVALSPTPDNAHIWKRLVRGVGRYGEAQPPVASAGQVAELPDATFPTRLIVLAAAFALLLAVNEHLLARLPLARGEGSR